MNPQCGYYQNGQTQQYTNNSRNQGAYRQQTYGGTGTGASCRPGNRMYTSTIRNQPVMTQSTNGFYSNQGTSARAPPVFSTSSSGNFSGSQRGYPSQSSCTNRNGSGNIRQQQRVGGAIPLIGNNYKMGYQPPQKCSQQHPLAPAPFCTPQAIKINVTADQLANAQSKPYQDRGEPSVDGNPGTKYIQLNWQDLLGGMENLRVTMAPSPDPCNQNQQLRVSFGGQKTDPPQAGETCLKVVSIEPASTGRMDIQQGKALAGAMKICNSPITSVVPMNANNACMQRSQQQQQPGQFSCGGGNRRNQQSSCCRK